MTDRRGIPPGVKTPERIQQLETKELEERLIAVGQYGKIRSICREHQATIDEVFGRSRIGRIAKARAAVWVYLRMELGWSWPSIAKFFGRADHSGIWTAVNREVRRAREAQGQEKDK